MATGRRPFVAEPATALINDVLNATPPSPRSLAPSISRAHEHLIVSLLERSPAKRPASAAVAAAALRAAAAAPAAWIGATGGEASARPGAGASGGPPEDGVISSIAVLPLANLTGASDQEFFADGMTEALITTLAGVRSSASSPGPR